MSNAFLSDEKRRYQFLPTEEPPNYDVAAAPVSEAGPSRARPAPPARRPSTGSDADDALDALPSDDDGDREVEAGDGVGHRANDHRADSEESAPRDFQELELETEPLKDPIHIRLSREIQRLTARVDRVLYTYVNPTVMRYFYGALLGLVVILLVWTFGGSLPKIVLPKRYQEDALRAYINEATSAANIRKFTEDAEMVYKRHHKVEALFDNSKLATWVHDEFVKFGVARNAIDDFFVYYPRPELDGQRLYISNSRGDSFEAPLVDDKDRLRAFVTHGASGNVTGRLVFANYGTMDDYKWLQSSKVVVDGSIVMFKRSLAVDLGTQIHTAQAVGAVGCILFFSAGDYGSDKGSTFPDGPYMPADAAENDDAAFTWVQPGDVLTPGWPSTQSTKVVEPNEAPALSRIPVISISSQDAERFLDFLDGSGVPAIADWNVSRKASGTVYTGSNVDGGAVVQLTSNLAGDLKHPIFNVLSEIEGNESDQVLVVGTSLSSLSSVAVLLEVSRIYAELFNKYAWVPRRSMIFAAWDATEQNYMGSTEWTEMQLKSLRQQGIAYINLGDAASLSREMDIRATPSLAKALFQALEHVRNVHDNATVAADLGLSVLSSLPQPSGFSDSIAFGAHAGTAVADIGFAKTPVYSACRQSARCIDDHVDPNFENHAVLAKAFAMIILELADERFIPLDVHAYARAIESDVQQLSGKYPQLNFGGDLNRVMQQFDYGTDMAMRFLDEWQTAYGENKDVEPPGLALKRSNWNYAVTTFHRNLLRSLAWTTWFEHPVYGPSQAADGRGERSWWFPHLEDVIATGDMNKAQGRIEMLGTTLLDASKALQF